MELDLTGPPGRPRFLYEFRQQYELKTIRMTEVREDSAVIYPMYTNVPATTCVQMVESVSTQLAVKATRAGCVPNVEISITLGLVIV